MKYFYLLTLCLFFTGCLSDRDAYLYNQWYDEQIGATPGRYKALDGTIFSQPRYLKWYESLSQADKQKVRNGHKYCIDYAKDPKNEVLIDDKYVHGRKVVFTFEQCIIDNNIPRIKLGKGHTWQKGIIIME